MYTQHAKEIISQLESGLYIGSTPKIVNRRMNGQEDRQTKEWMSERSPPKLPGCEV